MDATPFPFELAASDLDGTLLGPDKTISAANIAEVKKLRDLGVRFVLASGRRKENSIRFYRQLQLDTLLISCSGALVSDPQTGRVLREVLLTRESAQALVCAGLAYGFTIIYYHRDHLYSSARTHWTELYESRVAERTEVCPHLRDLDGEGALKIVWYGEPAAMTACRPKMTHEWGGRLNIIATDAENLEFSSIAGDKAIALSSVAKHYDVAQSCTLAFGDGENDAPMLRWAGCGVAMDGSHPVAQQAADVTGDAGPPETSFARGVEAAFAYVRRPNFRSSSA